MIVMIGALQKHFGEKKKNIPKLTLQRRWWHGISLRHFPKWTNTWIHYTNLLKNPAAASSFYHHESCIRLMRIIITFSMESMFHWSNTANSGPKYTWSVHSPRLSCHVWDGFSKTPIALWNERCYTLISDQHPWANLNCTTIQLQSEKGLFFIISIFLLLLCS